MIPLYTFTGTGNCRVLADELCRLLPGGQVFSMTEPASLPPEGIQAAALVFPVYYGGLPRAVFRFLRDFQAPTGVPLFAVAAYAYHPGAALVQVRDALARRGLSLAGGYCLQTPQTFQPGKTPAAPEQSAALWRVLREKKIPALAEEIRGVLAGERTAPPFPCGSAEGREKNRAFRILLPRLCKDFTANDRCLSCGRCAVFCPTENIRIRDGRPSWGGDCELCFACLSACPAHAIAWRGQGGEPRPFLHPDYRPPSKIARLRRRRRAAASAEPGKRREADR